MKVMFTKLFLSVLPILSGASVNNTGLSYLVGGLIALLILAYLIYTLFRPEKF